MSIFDRKILYPLVAMLALALVLLWMAGVFNRRIEPGLAPPGTPSDAAMVIVEASMVPVIEPVPATITAREATNISARIMARIESISVRAGDHVSKGQLLVRLEQTDLRSRAAQAEEHSRAAAARLAESQKNLARARDLQRQGLLATVALDRAVADFDTLTADAASARQALAEARTSLGFSEITAPIDGRVVDRFAEPGDTAAPGMRLLSIYNPLSLRVEAQVREELALSLVLGQELTVDIPALGLTTTAEIDELVPAADPGSRTFLVKARLAMDGNLLPGMYARLQIPAGRERVLLVPVAAVATVGQLEMVWVAGAHGVERRFVRLGRLYPDDRVAVIAGLSAGDRILAVGRDAP